MHVSLKVFRASRRSFIFAAALSIFSMIYFVGCRPKVSEPRGTLQASVQFEPTPPVAHHAVNVKVSLASADGKPLRLGRLDVEADMNHAGMSPVFAHFDETAPGQYSGKIEFTMGGDWFLLLSGQLPGNTHLVKKIDVPGVKAQ